MIVKQIALFLCTNRTVKLNRASFYIERSLQHRIKQMIDHRYFITWKLRISVPQKKIIFFVQTPMQEEENLFYDPIKSNINRHVKYHIVVLAVAQMVRRRA